MKGFTQEHEEIENIVKNPEFDKVDLVSQFIAELEKPSLDRIEEIMVKKTVINDKNMKKT